MEKRQGLSEKQEEFCRLLAEGKTTGEAERLIGFSKGYGWRLMRKEHIRRAIKVRKNPSAADAEETQKGVQQTEQPRKRETAKKAEILSFLTEVMRDEEEADLKTRMKAAELLGKRESLFEKKTPTEKESRVIIVDDLPGRRYDEANGSGRGFMTSTETFERAGTRITG